MLNYNVFIIMSWKSWKKDLLNLRFFIYYPIFIYKINKKFLIDLDINNLFLLLNFSNS
jgi:hypothetical protein